jgi:hypothetical protein
MKIVRQQFSVCVRQYEEISSVILLGVYAGWAANEIQSIIKSGGKSRQYALLNVEGSYSSAL